MQRLTFYQLFRVIDTNTIETIRRIQIGPNPFNEGDIIRKGTIIAGIDLFNYQDGEFEGEEDNGVWVVRRIYGRQ